MKIFSFYSLLLQFQYDWALKTMQFKPQSQKLMMLRGYRLCPIMAFRRWVKQEMLRSLRGVRSEGNSPELLKIPEFGLWPYHPERARSLLISEEIPEFGPASPCLLAHHVILPHMSATIAIHHPHQMPDQWSCPILDLKLQNCS